MTIKKPSSFRPEKLHRRTRPELYARCGGRCSSSVLTSSPGGTGSGETPGLELVSPLPPHISGESAAVRSLLDLPSAVQDEEDPSHLETRLGMDALKSAGRAMIKSPGVPRHTWGTSRHEKLPENWTDTKETLLEGMVFNVKYLGMTLVVQPKGEDMASAAIHRIVSMARGSAKKFRKVTLTVSPKGIVITDTETADLIEDVSIYRISYCTADKTQDKVFAYVSQCQFNETLECHAFLCHKRKIAQAVTLTVAQAFKVALDLWEVAQEDKSRKSRTSCSCAAGDGRTETTDAQCVSAVSYPHLMSPSGPEAHKSTGMEEKLHRPFFSVSLSSSSPYTNLTRRRPIKHDSWDAEDGLDDVFSSNMDVEETDADWPSYTPNSSLTMQL